VIELDGLERMDGFMSKVQLIPLIMCEQSIALHLGDRHTTRECLEPYIVLAECSDTKL
jgi:hypothetical protein